MPGDLRKAWGHLAGLVAQKDAPLSDNPSGLYCPSCRSCGLYHCSDPEHCGGMRPMRQTATAAQQQGGGDGG